MAGSGDGGRIEGASFVNLLSKSERAFITERFGSAGSAVSKKAADADQLKTTGLFLDVVA